MHEITPKIDGNSEIENHMYNYTYNIQYNLLPSAKKTLHHDCPPVFVSSSYIMLSYIILY